MIKPCLLIYRTHKLPVPAQDFYTQQKINGIVIVLGIKYKRYWKQKSHKKSSNQAMKIQKSLSKIFDEIVSIELHTSELKWVNLSL